MRLDLPLPQPIHRLNAKTSPNKSLSHEEQPVPIFAHMNHSISTVADVTTLGAISPVMTNLLVGLFLLVSIVMILLVLIQRPQGGGLSGAFGAGGGGGAGQTAFGTKTGDVLTWATIGIFICFLVFAIILNFATRPASSSQTQPVITAPVPADTSTPLDDGEASEPGEAIDLSGTPLDALEDDSSEPVEDGATEPNAETGSETGSETGTDLPAGDE